MKRKVAEHLVAMLSKKQTLPTWMKRNPDDRFDGVDHHPVNVSVAERRRCVCHVVSRKTRTFCSKCNVPLCIDKPCWKLWHSQENYLYEDPAFFGCKLYRKKPLY